MSDQEASRGAATSWIGPTRTRGLQRIASQAGLLLVVDLRALGADSVDTAGPSAEDASLGRVVLAGISPWASAVIVGQGSDPHGWIEQEAVPRDVGIIREVAATEAASAVVSAHWADAVLVASPATPTRFNSAVLVESSAQQLDQAPPFGDVVVVSGTDSLNTDGLLQIDERLTTPWIGQLSGSSFPAAVAQSRVLAAAGASGVVAGPELWSGIELDQGAEDDKTIEEIRGRVLSLLLAITSGTGSWESGDVPSADGLTWFGARSFVHHRDIDRYEERVIAIRARSVAEALDAGMAEVDEYATIHGASALDLVQVAPIRTEHDTTPSHLSEWVEVYSQMHTATNEHDYLSRFLAEEDAAL